LLQRLLDAQHTNMFWVTALFYRVGRWVSLGLMLLILGTAVYLFVLLVLWTRQRRRRARELGQRGVGWLGLQVELSQAVVAFRRRWRLVAGLVSVFLLTQLLSNPFYKWSYEYSGSCGRFRECARIFWGLKESCSFAASSGAANSSVKPFATEGDCDADWQAFVIDFHWLTGAAGSGASWGAPPAKEIVRFYEREQDLLVKNGRYAVGREARHLFGSYVNNSPDTCQGFHTSITAESLQVAVPVKDRDGTESECWVLNPSGELRHFRRDQPSWRKTGTD
jgi:hypothetical protein